MANSVDHDKTSQIAKENTNATIRLKVYTCKEVKLK